MKKRKMFMRMVTASILRRRSKILIALLSIVVGATILCGLITIYKDVPRQMGAQFRNYGANMLFMAEEDSFTLEDVEEALTIIPDDEVVGVAPYRYENVRLRETPVVAAATDMQGAQKTSPYWDVDGQWPSQSGELMIGQSVSEDYSLAVGDTITITYAPEDDTKADDSEDDETTLDNYIDFKVTAILSTGGSEEDYIYMSLEDMETLTGEETSLDITELSVSSSSDMLNSYVEQISDEVDGINAKTVKRVTASETTVLSKLQALVLLVTIIVLALMLICVATTMAAVVAERRKEIGLRKALGASNGSIVKEFMGEGILLGVIGGIFGSILGFLFAQLISTNVFSSSITFSPVMVPVTIGVSVLVTAVATLLPIRSAIEVDPALVLKGE